MDARQDPFEAALRSILRDQARQAVPRLGMAAMVDAVIADVRPRRPARSVRWSRALTALAACVVLVMATGLVLGSASVPRWAWGGEDAGPAISWDSGAVRLEADSIRIVGVGTFTGTPDTVDGAAAIAIHSDPGDASRRTLEVEWREQGVPMRLYLYLAADDTHWWVTEMRTYDGSSRGEWIHYRGPLFRTPLGGTYAGDFAATGRGGEGPGSVRIDRLRLTAFAPGTGPAPRMGCRPWRIEPGRQALQPDDLVGMVPGQAATRLRERGLCYEFRWRYRTGQGTGYSERWCVPPPTGRVRTVDILDDVVRLDVEDDSGLVREVREQPPAGWGCPTDQRAAASQPPGSSPAPTSPSPSGSPVPAEDPPMPAGPVPMTVQAEVAASPAP